MSSTYLKLPIEKIQKLSVAPCDFYLKITEQNFVKIINANDLYEESLLLKKMKSGVNEFYIRQEDELILQQDLSQFMQLELRGLMVESEKSLATLKNAFDSVRDFAKRIELHEVTVQLIEGIQKSTIVSIRQNKKIFNLLVKKISDKNYLSQHSLMTSLVCCAAASKMSWSTQATLKKFILASLFHDIVLEDSKLGKVRVSSELEHGTYSTAEKKLVLQHPELGKDFYLGLELGSPNTEQIILSHHELPDGSGFPHGLDAFKTPRYVCLFILAEELVNIFEHEPDAEKAWIITKEKFNTFYNVGNYRKIIEGYKELFPQLA